VVSAGGLAMEGRLAPRRGSVGGCEEGGEGEGARGHGSISLAADERVRLFLSRCSWLRLELRVVLVVLGGGGGRGRG
jgi:hypothetical protein